MLLLAIPSSQGEQVLLVGMERHVKSHCQTVHVLLGSEFDKGNTIAPQLACSRLLRLSSTSRHGIRWVINSP